MTVTIDKFNARSVKVRLAKVLGYQPTVCNDGSTIVIVSASGLDNINAFAKVFNDIDTPFTVTPIEIKQALNSVKVTEELKETNHHLNAFVNIKR